MWISLIGISGTLGQYFLTYAYMNAPAGIIAPIEYTRIVWGLLFGLYLGDTFLDLKSSLGVALILCSGLLIALPALLKELKNLSHATKPPTKRTVIFPLLYLSGKKQEALI